MRFLVDECAGPKLALWLADQGYEVYSIYEQARGSSDEAILRKAYGENWILITNDKDFGEKIYRERYPHHGVVFMRLQDERSANKIEVIRKLLNSHVMRLQDQFVVVTESRVRFGK